LRSRSIAIPSITVCRSSCDSEKSATTERRAIATGCWGVPEKTEPISCRHHASFVRAMSGSETSSTTSSTSRQNA
jgi:hypothetical protein